MCDYEDLFILIYYNFSLISKILTLDDEINDILDFYMEWLFDPRPPLNTSLYIFSYLSANKVLRLLQGSISSMAGI
jgi:hypothetical protein